MRSRIAFGVALFVGLVGGHAEAHKPSDSYLTLRAAGNELTGRWDIALRDLDDALGLDRDGDGTLRWDEVRSRYGDALAWALPRLSVRSETGPCAPAAGAPRIVEHADGSYLAIELVFRCEEAPARLSLRYDLLFERDASHRGIAVVMAGATQETLVFTAKERERTLRLGAPSRAAEFGRVVRLGVEHIWSGYDHLLFLIALLLPAVLRREAGHWLPVTSFRPTLRVVLRTVTAFTLAHSLTLALAALGLVALPSRLIESAIALSVVLAAANNLWPVVRADRWVAAFELGLLHGFGFASALADAGLAGRSLTSALFGFNLGVELGQMAIVVAILPVAYATRTRWFYTRYALGGGSVAVALIASVWLIERAFAVRVIS
jgi:hypothetical protein